MSDSRGGDLRRPHNTGQEEMITGGWALRSWWSGGGGLASQLTLLLLEKMVGMLLQISLRLIVNALQTPDEEEQKYLLLLMIFTTRHY